jgi:hypothetical protein
MDLLDHHQSEDQAMVEVPLRLTSAPLEVFAGSQDGRSVISHNISTSHPDLSNSQQPAIAVGCYTDSALALISAPYGDQCLLELRTFPLDSSSQCPAVHQLIFPAPILGNAFLSSASNNTLTLQVCTSSGVIFRILLPLELLDTVDEIPAKWISEHALVSLGGDLRDIHKQRLLTSFHTSQDGSISLASCTDGRVIKVVWEGETNAAKVAGESRLLMDRGTEELIYYSFQVRGLKRFFDQIRSSLASSTDRLFLKHQHRSSLCQPSADQVIGSTHSASRSVEIGS